MIQIKPHGYSKEDWQLMLDFFTKFTENSPSSMCPDGCDGCSKRRACNDIKNTLLYVISKSAKYGLIEFII